MPKTTGPQPRRAIPDGPLAGRVKGRPQVLAALAKAGITTTTALRAANLTALAKRTKLPVDTLAAIHLQAEIPGLEAAAAKALVTKGGIRSRDALATAGVEALVRKLDGASADPRRVAAWVAIARSGNIPVSGRTLKPAAVRRALAPLIAKVRTSSPHATIVDPAQLLDPALQTEALARMRGLMHDAGVHDLATLGTYVVDTSRVIRPGYHVARPTAASAKTATAARKLEAALIRHGRTRKKRVEVQGDALWFMQVAVTDAVIFGSALAFPKAGDLVLGREVTSLVIITDTLNANFVRRIRYEDQDLAPEPRSPVNPPKRSVGTPDFNPAEYVPDEEDDNTGASGGDGSDGLTGNVGTKGDEIGPAPSVTLYVKRTPHGLPEIDLNGRSGGAGGPGQHGGTGGSGAAGQPGKSVVLVCTRSVGNGGDGGDGGDGGTGGRGGQGATGGSVTVHTLADNLASLAGGELKLEGGPGGAGGDRGLGGSGGAGGEPGKPRGVCSAKPNRVGRLGSAGAPGPRGAAGAQGDSGDFAVFVITESDWNAAFTQPWIVRLDPWEALPNTTVRIVALNLTGDTAVLYRGSPLPPQYLISTDPAEGIISVMLPGGATGLVELQLRAPAGNDGDVFSQPVMLRVLLQLEEVAPREVVPGITLKLTAHGVQPDAVLVIAGHRLPIVVNEVHLPERESNDIPEGTHDVKIVNPDGQTSTTLTINLRCTVSVRMKAWRVFPDDDSGDGTVATDDDIRKLFNKTPSPHSIWLPHGIAIRLDPEIETAILPADLAEQFPHDEDLAAGVLPENFLEQRAPFAALIGSDHFEPGAVNVYFFKDIQGTLYGLGDPEGIIVIGDTTFDLRRKTQAIALSHEFGHVFNLAHVSEDDTTGNLMFPYGGPKVREGVTLTEEQVFQAYFGAAKWHDPE